MRSVQNDEKWSFFIDLFPQVFRQVNEWPLLEFHELLKVPHVAAWKLFSFFFNSKIETEECSNLWKAIIF